LRIARRVAEVDPPFGAGVRPPPMRGCRAPVPNRCGMRLRPLVLLVLLGLLTAGAARATPQRPATAAIFYYPWYGSMARDGAYLHWAQNGRRPPGDIASHYYPARGAYSSADPKVLAAQMRDLAATGVRQVVTSWWGWGSLEDERLPTLLRGAKGRGADSRRHRDASQGEPR